MAGTFAATARFQDSSFQKAVKIVLRCILSVIFHLSGFKLWPSPIHAKGYGYVVLVCGVPVCGMPVRGVLQSNTWMSKTGQNAYLFWNKLSALLSAFRDRIAVLISKDFIKQLPIEAWPLNQAYWKELFKDGQNHSLMKLHTNLDRNTEAFSSVLFCSLCALHEHVSLPNNLLHTGGKWHSLAPKK